MSSLLDDEVSLFEAALRNSLRQYVDQPLTPQLERQIAGEISQSLGLFRKTRDAEAKPIFVWWTRSDDRSFVVCADSRRGMGLSKRE